MRTKDMKTKISSKIEEFWRALETNYEIFEEYVWTHSIFCQHIITSIRIYNKNGGTLLHKRHTLSSKPCIVGNEF